MGLNETEGQKAQRMARLRHRERLIQEVPDDVFRVHLRRGIEEFRRLCAEFESNHARLVDRE